MNLLYPPFLWLFLPLVLLAYLLRPRHLVPAVHLMILGLIILALARPQLKEGISESTIDARDMLIALDVSYSMRAQDIKPDRYRFAKSTIKSLLQQDTQDNIMFMAFTTNPLLLSPPTTDHRLIATALDALEPKNILTKGTSLRRLFKKIASLKKVHREVVLITDGGEEKDLSKLLDAIEDSDMHLSILAMGTDEGTTVPNDNGTLLKDAQHHLVVSRINPLLAQFAEATGGTYLTAASTPQESAQAILSSLKASEAAGQQITKQHYAYTELYWVPLLIAVILFLLVHTWASRYLLLVFALAGLSLQAGIFDALELHNAYDAYTHKSYDQSRTILHDIDTPTLEQRYALASVAYRLGNYAQARQLYASIKTTSPVIKQKLYYNIANTYTMERKYGKAKMYYTKALQLGDDADALHNLSLIMQLKEKNASVLSMTRAKSQGAQSRKNRQEEASEKASKKHKNQQQSSGSGSGGQEQQSNTKTHDHNGKLELDAQAKPQPLSSKVYELINKGYMRETQPW